VEEETTELACSDCGAPVLEGAKACTQCGVTFEETIEAEEAAKVEETEYVCSECDTTADVSFRTCPKCGALLQLEYYGISVTKLVLLSLLTLGLYELYWFYRNWSLIKAQEQVKIIPILRAVFSVFFCYQLFKKVRLSAQALGYKRSYSPALSAAGYIIITLLVNLPDPFWFFALFAFLPLLSVQDAIIFNNLHLATPVEERAKFSTVEIIVAVVGGIILALGLASIIV
jgi:RNA polymerase subunit RPABC4/transcription elongation factor Spt4